MPYYQFRDLGGNLFWVFAQNESSAHELAAEDGAVIVRIQNSKPTGFVIGDEIPDVDNILDGIDGFNDYITPIILDPIDGFVDDTTEINLDILGDIFKVIGDWTKQAGDTIESNDRVIADAIGNLQNGLINLIGLSDDFVLGRIGELIDGVIDWEVVQRDYLEKFLDDRQQDIDETNQSLWDKVQGGIDNLLGSVVGSNDSIFGILGGGFGILGQALNLGLDSLGVSLTSGFQALGNSLASSLTNFLPNVFGDLPDAMISEIDQLGKEAGSEDLELLGDTPFAAVAALLATPGAAFVIGLSLPLVFGNLVTRLMEPFTERIYQLEARKFPFQYLDIATLSSAVRRGIITEESRDDWLLAQGWRPESIEVAGQLQRAYPDNLSLLDWWHRGILAPDAIETRLHEIGFDPEDVDMIKQASFIIPSIQDMITFAVREVYTPEVAEAFGQFEDFPEEFAAAAEQRGLTREVALQYWGAHWGLPSPRMGYEMLHRGVIDEEELKTLLRALDVMPGWRDPMIAISYRPFSRVDVRRMRRLDILDRDGVLRSYKDLGYDNEKAEALTEFTERLVANQKLNDTKTERDLSRSDVLGLYRDGILERAEAKDMIVRLRYDANEAEALLERVDLANEVAARRAAISLVIDKAKVGQLSYQGAIDEFNKMNLTPRELDVSLSKLISEIDDRTTLPTVAQIQEFLNGEAITVEQAIQALRSRGYADLWISIYLQAYFEGFNINPNTLLNLGAEAGATSITGVADNTFRGET
tara:strand:- start:3873 stop:6146 length:2274 start_codon:yes stop_codon:yes gene_type:complete